MTRYAPFPLTTTALLLVGCFTLGLLVATQAGLMGILLAVPLIGWFLRYCYLQVDAILAGAAEAPGASFDHLINPLADRRAIAQALLMAAGAGVVLATVKLLGFVAGAICTAVLLAWLPASIAVLAATGDPLRALWPPQLLAFARICGPHYMQAMLASVALGSLLFALLRFAAPLWIVFPATQLMLLMAFAMVAGALFEHSQELGLDPAQVNRPAADRASDRTSRQLERERGRMLERSYLKLKTGNPLESWKEVQAWLAQHDRGESDVAERSAILAITSTWDDPRPADRITDEVIALLLARRESARALEVLESRVAANPRFRPSSAHRPRLAELATAAGKAALRRHLDAFSNTLTQTASSRATRW